jgi:hypothetical protein
MGSGSVEKQGGKASRVLMFASALSPYSVAFVALSLVFCQFPQFPLYCCFPSVRVFSVPLLLVRCRPFVPFVLLLLCSFAPLLYCTLPLLTPCSSALARLLFCPIARLPFYPFALLLACFGASCPCSSVLFPRLPPLPVLCLCLLLLFACPRSVLYPSILYSCASLPVCVAVVAPLYKEHCHTKVGEKEEGLTGVLGPRLRSKCD